MTQGIPSVFLADLNKKYSCKSLFIALTEERESDVHEFENELEIQACYEGERRSFKGKLQSQSWAWTESTNPLFTAVINHLERKRQGSPFLTLVNYLGIVPVFLSSK